MRLRTSPTLTALLLALTLSVAACGSEGDDVASDPGGSGPDAPQPPAAVPAAPGEVRSVNLVTVMDTDTGEDRVELCLGAVAESYPPQCGGPAITNWSWDAFGQDMDDEQGTVRWGTYAVTGGWDGNAFTVSETVPGALYDPMIPTPVELPTPSVDHADDELQAIAENLMELPGALGTHYDDGRVFLDVTYDDGTYQDYADQAYGDGVVVVSGALVDVE